MWASLLSNYAKSLSAVVVLAAGTLAYAQEPPRLSAAGRDRAVAPSAAVRERLQLQSKALAFPVPTTGAPIRIDAELRLDGKVIMTEQRTVSEDFRRVITLFAHGAGHFGALRDQDARKPGRVQLRIVQDGKQAFNGSLTEFDTQYPEALTTAKPRLGGVAANDACSENCDAQYMTCLEWCDPRGDSCQQCAQWYNDCMASCPTCDDWYQVSHTLIGRRNSGTSNILGAQYCNFEEYYLNEEANAAGCYPNRTVCDYDDDVIFYGFGSGHPSQEQCCNDDYGDENYCGGDLTTC